MDCVPNIWADAPKSMIQQSNEEVSKVVPRSKVDA